MSALILVVDDEPAIRGVLAAVLADEGYRVVTARDGQEALEQLAREHPDLILSDVTMPRMGGVALVRRICHRHRGVPVVVVSAYHAGVDEPGVRFVPEPFDLDRLADAVAGCLAGA